MAFDLLSIALALATVLGGIAVFLSQRLLRSVMFLAATAVFSALIFIYLGQTLLALLQLLVFVGGLSTYLLVAVATEERKSKMINVMNFAIAGIVISLAISALVSSPETSQPGTNSFGLVAEAAFQQYYALLLAAVFLLFAVAVGSVLVMKKFAKLVF